MRYPCDLPPCVTHRLCVCMYMRMYFECMVACVSVTYVHTYENLYVPCVCSPVWVCPYIWKLVCALCMVAFVNVGVYQQMSVHIKSRNEECSLYAQNRNRVVSCEMVSWRNVIWDIFLTQWPLWHNVIWDIFVTQRHLRHIHDTTSSETYSWNNVVWDTTSSETDSWHNVIWDRFVTQRHLR